MYQKVIQYCQEKGISVLAFEKMCGLSNGTVQGWKVKGSNPSMESMKKIMSATETSFEYWQEGNGRG